MRKKKLKVLYIFTGPRQEYIRKVNHGLYPRELYGFFSIQKFGIDPLFSDKAFLSKGFMYILSQLIQRTLTIRVTKMGFKIDQAIKLLPYMRKADVVFTTTDSCGLPVLFIKTLGIINKPIVYQTIGLYDNYLCRGKGGLAFFYKQLLNSADKIICYSSKEKEGLLGILSVPRDRIEVVLLGVDIDYFTPEYNWGEDYIISIGRNPHRDYRTLFEAIEQTRLPSVVICSRQNIAGLKVPDNCRILFDLPISEVRRWLGGAKMCIVPTRLTAYPTGQTVVLQAMSMQKPVITTDKAWLAEYGIQAGTHYLKVPPGSARSLRQAIICLWEDQNMRARLARNGRNLVEEKFSIDYLSAQLSEIFFKCV